nr:RNA-directed DNA polymerase, eukaryota, reverse transcriptase zinc-binding domain protein [Tanacetum cinerariifolium]
MSVCAKDGTRYKNYDVAEQFVKHFTGFLGNSPAVTNLKEEDSGLFERKISQEEGNLMTFEINDAEIKKTLFDTDDNKAPRPDGFISKFYKKSWEIIKNDFCTTIREFFTSGKLLEEINATLISLVPKSLTLLKVSDLRPIACCNDEIKKNKDFKYHFGCKEMKITHLCFEDDIIMLSYGDKLFVTVLKEALDKAQLIASVLGSMQVYWGSVFLLPNIVVKKLRNVLRNFYRIVVKVAKVRLEWPGNFSTNAVWKDVRGSNGKVCWSNLLWNPNCIPKHTFILWLAAKEKLCTQDKMTKWYPNKHFKCSLCNKEPDSHHHLFFECDYAQKQSSTRKTKSKTTGSNGGCQSGSISESLFEDLRRKVQEAESTYKTKKAKELVYMERKELEFLMIDADALPEPKATIIRKKQENVMAKNN